MTLPIFRILFLAGVALLAPWALLTPRPAARAPLD